MAQNNVCILCVIQAQMITINVLFLGLDSHCNFFFFFFSEIVSTLQACDEEIFNGWQQFPVIFITSCRECIYILAVYVIYDNNIYTC